MGGLGDHVQRLEPSSYDVIAAKFVAVAGTGAGAFAIRYSSDGSTWTAPGSIPANPGGNTRTRENAIGTYSGRTIVLHNTALVSAARVLYSDDGGVTWAYSGATGPQTGESIAADDAKWSYCDPIYCDELSAWFVWLYNTTDNKSRLYRSGDGLVWTLVLAKTNWVVESIACQGSLLVSTLRAQPATDGGLLIWSVDGGLTWKRSDGQFPTTSASAGKVITGDGQFFAIDPASGVTMVSNVTGDAGALT